MKKSHKKKIPKSFLILCILIVLLLGTAIFAPLLAPHDPNKTELSLSLLKPCKEYPLGCDAMGRCMLSRILYGARVSIFSSLAIVFIVSFIGTLIGVFSGYFGGITDKILSKCISIMQAFPKMILAIAIAGVMGIGIENTIFALCIVEWAEYARLSRSLTMGIRNQTFIKAARVCGESHFSIIIRQIIPNVIPTLIVNASLGIASMIMEVAALSYLGLGVRSPMAEWGAMMNAGRNYLQTDTRLVIIPGVAIFLTAVIFNLFGDKLRDVLDGRV